MNAGKIGLAILAAGVLLCVIFGFAIPVSLRSNVTTHENDVVLKSQNCMVTYENGLAIVVGLAEVDSDTKNKLVQMLKAVSGTPEVTSVYETMVNTGDSGPMMLMMSSLIGGTDFTITSQKLQAEIINQRQAMTLCSLALNDSKNRLMNSIGYDPSRTVIQKWPQSMYFSVGEFPSNYILDPNLRDSDGDGRLTVMDYRPPVSISTSQMFGGNGEVPSTEIYK